MADENARTVVITGGSKGIGRSVAYRFAEENARIVLIHFDPTDDSCNETLDQLKARSGGGGLQGGYLIFPGGGWVIS